MSDNIENREEANEQNSQNQNVNEQNQNEGANQNIGFDPREMPNAEEAFKAENQNENQNQSVDPEYQEWLRNKETLRRQERAKNDVAAARAKMEKLLEDGDAPEEFRKHVLTQFDDMSSALVDKGRPQNEIFRSAKLVYESSRKAYTDLYLPMVKQTEENIKKQWGEPLSQGNAPRKQDLSIADWHKLPEEEKVKRVGEIKKTKRDFL